MVFLVLSILVRPGDIGGIDHQAFKAGLLQLPAKCIPEGSTLIGEAEIHAWISLVQMMHQMIEPGSDTGIAEQKSIVCHSHLPAKFMDVQSDAKRLVGK